ncbi:MAG: permease-like cell division protein FtsX, partial [Oscillospiraceae bacterium]
MNTNSLSYLVKESFKSVWKNRLMSFASIGVLTACLILIGGCYLISENINHIVDSATQQNEIIAFINDFSQEEKDAKTTKTIDEIKALANVSSVEYISKEQALNEQIEKLGPELHEGLEGDNPYPAYCIIKISDLNKIDETVSSLQSIEDIYKVNSSSKVAQLLISVKNTVQIIGMVTFTILVLVALVIISNTVRLTVFSRRKEINIMKYVGATNSFIRTPFIAEGFIIGIVSAIVAYLVIWGGY